MNKYTIAEAKVGDYFLHLEDKGVYKLLSVNQVKHYKFLEMRTKQERIQTRKWFMKHLMPAPRAARVLYEADET